MPYLAGSMTILHLLLLHKQKCVFFWHLFVFVFAHREYHVAEIVQLVLS